MLKQEIISLVMGVYMWFNQISDPASPFKQKDLEKYFTPDFIMDTNNKIVSEDYESLYEHFEEFRKSGALLKTNLPLKEIVISDDLKKAVARYSILEILKSGKKKEFEIIAIWHISSDGRLQRMNEIVYEVSK